MNKEVYKLKNLLYDLEYYIQRNQRDEIVENTKKIKEICNVIELNIDESEIELDCNGDECLSKEDMYEVINELEFMYLPFNYLREENTKYFKYFSNKRSETLTEANALKGHNEFWSQHKAIYGNVYGSIPKELIDSNNISVLENYGWKNVSVEILDFSNSDFTVDQIRNFCQKNLYRYILVQEQKTNEYLVLNYNIEIDGVYK